MKERKCRRGVKVVTAIVLLGGILFFWTYVAERNVRYTPDYPMEDITPFLEKMLTEKEYEFLYRQTGLSPIAVDTLRKENRSEELLAVQERFFAEAEIDCECNFLIFRETLKLQDDKEIQVTNGKAAVMPVLEEGDILITFSTHFLGWRNGHAALVVDAKNGRTLEAMTLGRDSAILSLKSWAERPSFAVLRLANASKEQRAEIAAYAKETLTQLPYQLSAGIWEGIQSRLQSLENETNVKTNATENETNVKTNATETKNIMTDSGSIELMGTQCAHLIWCAFQKFGYDLDSDGGLVVTPKDLYESPLLEVIQVYGMKPE